MSFYTSLSGLRNAQTDLDVVSNNIANAETYGYKKSRVEFGDIVAGTSYSAPGQSKGMGATVERIAQNFSVGPMEQTGAALDMAIGGEGFFATRNPLSGQTLFTRSGSFAVDENGMIRDSDGNRLQIFGPGGTTPMDAVVPAASSTTQSPYAGVSVASDGMVTATFADGSSETVGRVALAGFVSPAGLKPVGSSNWEATGISGAVKWGSPGDLGRGELMTGTLERSNVDIAEELVHLITAQRQFQANAKAIDTATQVSQTIIGLRT